ncbi:MAG: hypothetical protein H7263_17505, partial [Candidatus Sericytochromatia bacterium]|nr:hypothetical protein [Candidatus Sericytochromatia bacterium]
KSITVVQLKDGKVIGQSTYDQTVLLDKSVIISVNPTPLQTPGIVSSPVESSTSTATPLSSPTIFPSDNGNSSNNNTPSPIVTFTPIPVVTSTPTPTDTPIPTSTSTNYFPSHGGGGAVNPTIQVSATVNPDNTGVK